MMEVFHENSLRKMLIAFDTDKDGHVSEGDLRALLKEAGVSEECQKGDSAKGIIKDFLAEFDKDRDGK